MINIILPTDFSENSKHAIKYARALFQDEPCHFYLVNSYETPHAGAGMLVSIVDVLKEESEKDLDNFYKNLEEEGLTTGAKFQLVSDHGSLIDVIERLIRRYEIDLIVMGTKGAGGLREVLIGSNTSDVIKSGVCSTLAVPNHAPIKSPEKIVFASDNKGVKNEETFKALNFIVEKHQSELFILNIKNSVISTDPTDEIKQNFAGLLGNANYTFQTVENEDVEQGINDYIDLNNMDMLAMVSRKIGFFESLFHTSMTKELAMHATVPLLAMYE